MSYVTRGATGCSNYKKKNVRHLRKLDKFHIIFHFFAVFVSNVSHKHQRKQHLHKLTIVVNQISVILGSCY